jgi:hypothetical protein
MDSLPVLQVFTSLSPEWAAEATKLYADGQLCVVCQGPAVDWIVNKYMDMSQSAGLWRRY